MLLREVGVGLMIYSETDVVSMHCLKTVELGKVYDSYAI